MSQLLWKHYLEDDVDRFRHLLETAAYNVRNVAHRGAGNTQSLGGGPSGARLGTSPGSYPGSSPVLGPKSRKPSAPQGGAQSALTLTRTDINWRDQHGLTVLHHAASSTSGSAIEFAQALLEHPLVDLYLQDYENGWTALHRAFYFGNITIARAILERDANNTFGRSLGGRTNSVLGLIKIRDHEGLGPLDLYAATIQDRTLHIENKLPPRSHSTADSEPDAPAAEDEDNDHRTTKIHVDDIGGDECYTFGNNRNITLGFGDEDDRQWPERITLRRPEHLLQRFYREHMEHVRSQSGIADSLYADDSNVPVDAMPWVVRDRPIRIQDVRMSKLHTAVLTDDPESNLHVCGHGPGGRLGLGHEKTQFNFACVEGGALAGKRVASVALGQNHSLAISDTGELFSWGSNAFGQLGYSLPKSNLKDDEPVQLLPRQIFGPVKREVIQGIAASRVHSVAYTGSSLYTWGKNDGQLGLVDSDARSLEMQTTPRKVAASLFPTPIAAIAAIDRATICLLSGSHDCWVFANYGYAKVQAAVDPPLASWTFKVDNWSKNITGITAGGDTVCAVSDTGEVYSFSITQPTAGPSSSASTTNPTKIRAALTSPQRIWALKTNNMAARDVGVDADGSIIITTQEGSVWKRTRRAKIKDAIATGPAEYRPKDYKFSRISGLTRVIGVRASSYGAYAAIRRDCDVAKAQIVVEAPTLLNDLFPLLAFSEFTSGSATARAEALDELTKLSTAAEKLGHLGLQIFGSKDIENELQQHMVRIRDPAADGYDYMLSTTVSDLRIPVHYTVLAARSPFLRHKLAAFVESSEDVDHELFRIKKAAPLPHLEFPGLDPLTLINFVRYCYTDTYTDYWHYASRSPANAHRYRTIRTEMMKLASTFGMRKLEASVRQMIAAPQCISEDFEVAFNDPTYYENADILVELADDEVAVHSSIVCRRCPFFEGMFMGRAGGRWLDARRAQGDGMTRVDLKHIETDVFRLVLRHIYADSGEELFDHVVSADLEDHFDFLMEVLSVANELMLDRLAQICQKVMGRYVNVRNVCSLLNAVAPSAVSAFKDASLEYMCLNLEAMLHTSLLDELDEDLLLELDAVVRSNQLARLPFSRSGNAEAELLQRHPELPELMERNRQMKIDSIAVRSKHHDTTIWASGSYKASYDEDFSSPAQQKARRRSKGTGTARQSPSLKGKEAADRFGTSYDEHIDDELDLGAPALTPTTDRERSRQDYSGTSLPKPDVWYDAKGKALSPATRSPAFGPSKTRDPISPALRPLPSPLAAGGSAPWGSSPASTKKLDLKDIMSSTSSNRVSSLSAGLAAAKLASDTPVIPGPGARMSQKERKRSQQQQAVQQEEEKRRASAVADLPAWTGTPPPKAAPWQTVGSAIKVPSLKDVMKSAAKPPQPPPTPRTPSTPQLTMRQTVANPKPAGGSTPKPQSISHSPATPSSMPRPSTADRKASASAPTAASVRHQPRPVLPVTQLSMADILSQQQEEKDSVARVKEENAKRRLQDIQAEQEFQQWWEMEERRYALENGLLTPEADAAGNTKGKGRRKAGAKADQPRPPRRGGRSGGQAVTK